eukprot:TRINITY_DN11343_c0_g1_i1.p1 TRINITY_DN11343_c0_g1~~TRINITY_DN11343_c0_g1_i1.p1  ORF type:complete len:313 (-),score=41.25 TRINITY_DN11343_c0_g1_i1:8-946(-)
MEKVALSLWAISLCAVLAEGTRPSATEHHGSNLTVVHLHKEYELQLAVGDEDGKFSKTMLIFITGMCLGGCGVDRYIAGQTGLAVAKCITCGGCSWWFVFDWILIVRCCLMRSKELKELGWDLKFRPDTEEDAYNMAIWVACIQGPCVFMLLLGLTRGLISRLCGGSPATDAGVNMAATLRRQGILSQLPTPQEINHVFCKFDGNKDGFINADELKEGLTNLGIQVTDEQISNLLSASDFNKDGLLSTDELYHLFVKEGAILAGGPREKQDTEDTKAGATSAPEKHDTEGTKAGATSTSEKHGTENTPGTSD